MELSIYNFIEKSCFFIFNTLYHQTAFSILLFIFIFILTYLLRKKTPRWQFWLWSLILIRLLLPTDLSLSFSARYLVDSFLLNDRQTIPIERNTDNITIARHFDKSPTFAIPVTLPDMSNKKTSGTINMVEESDKSLPLPVFLAAFWLSGCLVFSVLFLNKIRKIHSILDRSSIIEDKEIRPLVDYWRDNFIVTRQVKVYSSEVFLSPFTIGIFRPKIFIPAPILKSRNYETITSIIAHEMVHIKNFDHLWIRLQNILQIIYFFNPVVWYANRQINISRERVCDSVVLSRQVIDPRAFGKSIIDTLRININEQSLIESLLCFSNHKKIFEHRIKDVLSEDILTRQKVLYIFISVCFIGLFLLPMSSGKTGKKETESDSITPFHDIKTFTGLQQSKTEASKFLERGDEYLRNNDIEHAISAYSKALMLDPENERAYLGRGNAYQRKRDFDKAISDLSKAIKLNPGQYYFYTRRGDAYKNKGDLDKALSDFNRIIELEPDKSYGYQLRASLCFQKREFAKAFSDYDKIIELNPEDGNSYQSRAMAYSSKYTITNKESDFKKAISDINRAMEVDPKNLPQYYLSRGNIYFIKGDYNKALTDFDKTLELGQGSKSGDLYSAQAYYMRGTTFWKMKKYNNAINEFNRIVESYPESAGGHQGYVALASLLATCPDTSYRDGARAIVLAQKAVKIMEDYNVPDYMTLAALAAAYAETGRFEEAVSTQEEAINLLDKSASIDKRKEDYVNRLKSYKSKKPWKEDPVELSY